MIPLRIEGTGDRRPVATYVVAGLCVLVFAWSLAQVNSTIAPLRFHPGELSPTSWLTSAFLHGGFLHLLGNLIFLLVFGAFVETCIGWWRLVVLYLVCELGADAAYAVASWVASQMRPAIGASGAICGLMGFALALAPRARIESLWWYRLGTPFPGHRLRIPMVAYIALYVLWELPAIIVTPHGGLAWTAHMGGLVTGAGLAFWAMGRATEGTPFHVDRPGPEELTDGMVPVNVLAAHAEVARMKSLGKDDRHARPTPRAPSSSIFDRAPPADNPHTPEPRPAPQDDDLHDAGWGPDQSTG